MSHTYNSAGQGPNLNDQTTSAGSRVPNRALLSPIDAEASTTLNVPDDVWQTVGRKRSHSEPNNFTPLESPTQSTGDYRICRSTRNSCADFEKGQILWVPIHAANMDSTLTRNDPYLSRTRYGWVFSKSRLVVVFRIFQKHLECLPIYTHQGNGLEKKSERERKEYSAVKSLRWREWVPKEDMESPPLIVKVREGRPPMDPLAAVHVTESIKVDCRELVDCIGRMLEPSFNTLHRLRFELDQRAEEDVW